MNRTVSAIAAAVLVLSVTAASAQSERANIRRGNRLFEKGKYSEAEVEFKRAQQENPSSYEAQYNLGNALYKQGRNEDAMKCYSELAEDENQTENAASVHHNMGNAYMQSKKYDEAIECYKKSLRCKPDDMQTKFNLAYAQKLKQDQDKDKDKDQDKNQDQNQDQNNQNQNNPNQNQNNPDQNQNKDQNNQDQNNQDQNQDKGQQPPQNPNQADNERTLKAIQAAEDKTKDKVNKEQAEAYGRSQGKQW